MSIMCITECHAAGIWLLTLPEAKSDMDLLGLWWRENCAFGSTRRLVSLPDLTFLMNKKIAREHCQPLKRDRSIPLILRTYWWGDDRWTNLQTNVGNGGGGMVLGYHPLLVERAEYFSTMALVAPGFGIHMCSSSPQKDFMGNRDIRLHTVFL